MKRREVARVSAPGRGIDAATALDRNTDGEGKRHRPPNRRTVEAALTRALEIVLIVLMGAGVLNVLWQVASRFIVRRPSPWTEELARFLLMWVGLLGAAYVSGRKMHLAIDVVVRGLRGRARAVAEGAVDLLTALFAGLVLVAGGLRLVSLTLALGQTSAALGLPMGAVYLVLPLSGLIMAAYALGSFVRRLISPWTR